MLVCVCYPHIIHWLALSPPSPDGIVRLLFPLHPPMGSSRYLKYLTQDMTLLTGAPGFLVGAQVCNAGRNCVKMTLLLKGPGLTIKGLTGLDRSFDRSIPDLPRKKKKRRKRGKRRKKEKRRKMGG